MAMTTNHPVKFVLMSAAILGSISGCASVKRGDSEPVTRIFGATDGLRSFGSLSAAPEQEKIAALIKQEFKAWEGTRYRLGGNGRGGIDCSGFAQRLLASLFGVQLPRTTARQVRAGHRINRSQLVPGDLVFFRPHSAPRHVGVYVGNGEFVHASSSRGVMLSRLDSVYWRKHYWTSRRVIPATQAI
jgi:cell wall-associated NlpC family hydrolase